MLLILVFAFVTAVLLVKLNEILGQRIGHNIPKENLRDFTKPKVEEIPVAEKNEELVRKHFKNFELSGFLEKAKKAFEIIFKAYAEEDKATLHDLLMPQIYTAFSKAIDDRHQRGEILEGTIVGFDSSEIVNVSVDSRTVFITVKFVTSQSNVLKSAEGVILEGSADFVESRTDVWVFSRKINTADSRWYLYEIKSEE